MQRSAHEDILDYLCIGLLPKGGLMKKAVRLLLLIPVVAMATQSTAGAYPSCGYPYPCSFTEDDCSASYSQEYLYDCVSVDNQVWHLYQWSCSTRPAHSGNCYVP
jgi:hypothetical protein